MSLPPQCCLDEQGSEWGLPRIRIFGQSGLRKELEVQPGVFVVFMEPGQSSFPGFLHFLSHSFAAALVLCSFLGQSVVIELRHKG